MRMLSYYTHWKHISDKKVEFFELLMEMNKINNNEKNIQIRLVKK